MGKRSVKEDKSIWQRSREEAGLTREKASEAMGFVSDSRIEKYESGRSPVQPEEVLAMSEAYGKPSLCNYYCTHECPIGQRTVPEAEEKSLSEIVLQTLDTLNRLSAQKDRLIGITADGQISDDELRDFVRIEDEIREIARVSASLSVLIENLSRSGKIDRSRLDAARKALQQGKAPSDFSHKEE